jgi:hypothetical protein
MWKRELRKLLYVILAGAAACVVASMFKYQYLSEPFDPVSMFPDVIGGLVVAYAVNRLVSPFWDKRRSKPQPEVKL